jgi:hypothetical protein
MRSNPIDDEMSGRCDPTLPTLAWYQERSAMYTCRIGADCRIAPPDIEGAGKVRSRQPPLEAKRVASSTSARLHDVYPFPQVTESSAELH